MTRRREVVVAVRERSCLPHNSTSHQGDNCPTGHFGKRPHQCPEIHGPSSTVSTAGVLRPLVASGFTFHGDGSELFPSSGSMRGPPLDV